MTSEELFTSVWGPEYRTDRKSYGKHCSPPSELEDDAANSQTYRHTLGLGYLMPPLRTEHARGFVWLVRRFSLLMRNAPAEIICNILREKQVQSSRSCFSREALIAAGVTSMILPCAV